MIQIKPFYRLIIPFLILGASLFIVGCSSNNDNLSTLETVLENTFTGPDQKLNKLLDDPENLTAVGDNAETKNSETPTELDLYLEEMYQPHFTEDMYSEYVGEYAFSYQAKENDEMAVNNIDIKQKKSDEIIYDFTANIEYQEEDSEAQVYEIKGQTNFSEDGKIKAFKLYSDGGLSKALSES